jgi:hypothetical protein
MPNTFTVRVGPPEAESRRGWHAQCGCGAHRTVGGTDPKVRRVAEQWARDHLRSKHAVQDPVRSRTLRTRTFTGFRLAPLTLQEREPYHELRTAPTTLREHPVTLVFGLCWSLCFFGAFLLVREADRTPSLSHLEGAFLGLLLFVLFVGGGAFIATAAREVAYRRQSRAAAYLTGIGFWDRTSSAAPRPASDDHGNRPYWVTGGYDPDRYRSYSKQDLAIMRLYDIDGDTYDANLS